MALLKYNSNSKAWKVSRTNQIYRADRLRSSRIF